MLTYPGDRLAPSRPDDAEPSVPRSAAPSVHLTRPAGTEESAPGPATPSGEATVIEAVAVAAPLSPSAPRTGRPARTGTARKPQAGPAPFVEPKGCLYALSQPPLMLFLCVIGGLLGGGAVWDLLFL